MNELEKLFENRFKSVTHKYNPLQKEKARKLTENGDEAFSTTGSNLVDLLFMTEYYAKHLDEIKIGQSEKEKLFSMFIRDPRLGLGRRDMGRVLMFQSGVDAANIVTAGRFDDLLENPTNENLEYWKKAVLDGNELAKKWAPRRHTKNDVKAKLLARHWELSEKEYRLLVKTDTVENKLTHHREEEINFEHVPSLAMIKYFRAFAKKQPERFEEFRAQVKSGEKKLNVSTTNVFDIYRNRYEIDAQMFFDKLEKISINCIPVLDTSGSMGSPQDTDSAYSKAVSVAHYLSKCSSYCPNMVVTFSSKPSIIDMGKDRKGRENSWSCNTGELPAFKYNFNKSKYMNEMDSLYTGDCSNTNFGAVMQLLSNLNEDIPEYLVVLSDMEFDEGSNASKKNTMDLFKAKGYKTRIIWWAFNDRNKTAPEMDDDGNIFISGYSPFLLKYLESGFDANKFIDKLLETYKEKIK